MSYVLINNGVVQTYPYSYALFRAANPDVSFPREVTDEWLTAFNIYPVAPVTRPAQTLTTDFVEGTPVFLNNVWTQVWNEVPASAEQIVKRAKDAALLAEINAAKNDAWITAFLAMTLDESQEYILNNSATLAALRTNVARLAYAVRVLIRREFDV